MCDCVECVMFCRGLADFAQGVFVSSDWLFEDD
jgi:hypothetical protein